MNLHIPKLFKVLHQPHSIAQYHAKATQDILWTCLRFAISLQAKADQDLNLFESTLLRLLAEGESDLERLSQKMGLTNEDGKSSLVEFLSLKLQQLDLITDRLRLTPVGEQILDQINNNQTQVIGASIYFDLINHCWLPIITRGEITSINVEANDDGLVEFWQGTVGNPTPIRAIPLFSETVSKNAPNERDVIDIIKRFRQQKKKMELSFGKTRNDGFVTTKGTISVNSDGELVYLHCYAFMVSGTYSLYVSDGFRSGIQDRFTRGFNNRKNHDSNLSIKTAYEILYQKSRKNYPLKGMQKSKSLAKLYEELKNSQVKNSIDQSEYENNLLSFVSKSYYEIEKMLAECYAFSKLERCISELSSDPQRNANEAEKIALQIGFKFKDGKLVNKLLKTNKGSIIYLKAEQPEMSALLFCHLLLARNDEQQPMRGLAKAYPELLNDIAKLRRWRNPIDHQDANTVRNELGFEQIEFIHQLVERIRKIVSDWLKSNDNQVSEQITPNWLKEDIRSEANYKLNQHFGIMRSVMNERVYQGLFDALVFANLEDARDRTNALAGALQHAFYQACQSLDVNEANDIEFIKSQLVTLGAKQISKTNSNKVQQSLNGCNTTLGANFIAFWAQITDQQRKEFPFAEKLISAIDHLIKIRGHSGPILGQHETLKEIEKAVFKLIKILMEQYCG